MFFLLAGDCAVILHAKLSYFAEVQSQRTGTHLVGDFVHISFVRAVLDLFDLGNERPPRSELQ